MKKGFTLMELVIVIIILGILVTLGFRQYTVTIEKARGAEARVGLGSIRVEAYEFYLRNDNSLTPLSGNFDNAAAGIGGAAGMLPGPIGSCQASHYFSYGLTSVALTSFTATATRCGAGAGKPPPGDGTSTIVLTSDMASGADTWGGTGVFR